MKGSERDCTGILRRKNVGTLIPRVLYKLGVANTFWWHGERMFAVPRTATGQSQLGDSGNGRA